MCVGRGKGRRGREMVDEGDENWVGRETVGGKEGEMEGEWKG